MENQDRQAYIQGIRRLIQTLQDVQWDSGYSEKRAEQISQLKAHLKALLGDTYR